MPGSMWSTQWLNDIDPVGRSARLAWADGDGMSRPGLLCAGACRCAGAGLSRITCSRISGVKS
jgi:hypothetical protein